MVKEQGMTCPANMNAANPLASLQAASCTYRIALGLRAGQKVLSLRTVAVRDEKNTRALCPILNPNQFRPLRNRVQEFAAAA